MKAEQVLPDSINEIDIDGQRVRKGTVAAFIANARVWTDRASSEAARSAAADDIVTALPALRAIGLFEVLEIRDASLRDWIGSR